MKDSPQLLSIFCEARERPSAEERGAYLDQACGDDAVLRARVEALLHAEPEVGNFLRGDASPASDPFATVDSPIAEGPGTVIGAYKLLEQIGEGGFGVVFMAEQQQPVRRKVALKVLKPGMDTRQVAARFEAERQALALMDHPNIAHVFDGGATASGRPYFVMELVRGVPVTDFCDQNKLAIRERLELFIDVCQAVQHAHQKGIIHRDIKPSNVLVTLHDDKALVKVIDFGIAKATGQQLTEKTLFTNFAQMIGTPLYMSPEQAQMTSLDVDTRSDVYSLGVLMYELLTGTTPFDKERLRTVGFDEIRRIIREEEPPRPSTRISTMGQPSTAISTQRKSDPKRLSQLFRGELDWIVMKALEKDRNRRYETASAFVADVQRYLDDEPVLACPPSVGYRMRKLARRHMFLVRAIVAVVFVVVVATIVLLWREKERADAAKAQTDENYQALDKERQRTLANLGVATDALQDIYLREGESRLFRDEGPPEVPERILRQGLEFYKRLDLDSGGEPQARLERAKAHLTVGYARTWLGKSAEAEADYRQAVQMAADLAAMFPDDPAYPEVLALGSRSLGALLVGLGRYQEAETFYRRALALMRERARDALNKQEIRVALANVLQNLAVVLLALERGAEAVDAAREAQELLEHLIAEHPDNPSYHALLGTALNTLATSRQKKGERTEAVQLYRRAIEQGLAGTKDPNAPLISREALGNHYYLLGQLILEMGNRTEAEKAWREAVAVQGRLADGWPGIVKFRYASSETSWRLGNLLIDSGRSPEAADVLLQPINREEARADQIRDRPHHLHLLANLHFRRGLALKLAGRPKEAEPHYLRALAIHRGLVGRFPESAVYRHELAGGLFDLALVYWQLQQYDKVIGCHSEAIAREPTNATIWNNRGIAYISLHQYDKAVEDLSKALELDSKHVGAWANRGTAYVQLRQYEKAIVDSSEAIKLDPKSAAAWNVRGSAHFGLSQYDEAILDFSSAIKLDSNHPGPWSNRGDAYRKLRQEQKAVDDYLIAVKLDPKHYQAWVGLGNAYAALSQYDQAITAYRHCDQLKPDAADKGWGLGNVGVALHNQGRLDEAIAVFTEVIGLKPDDDGAHNNLGRALEAKGLLDQAIVAYGDAIRHLSAKPPQKQTHDYATGRSRIAIVHNNLGNVLAKKGLLDQAIEAYRDAIRDQQDYAMAHSNLGGVLMNKGLIDEAIQEHKVAIRIQPTDAEFHYNFGIAFGHHGLLNEAVAEYKAAIGLRPEFAGYHCELAGVLRRQERFVDSLAAYKRGHELGSKQSDWGHPTGDWVREAERLVALDAKLSKIERGEVQLTGAIEQIELARFCQVHKKRRRLAARFYVNAFAAEPKLAEDLKTQDRYNAARAAVLAAGTHGKDHVQDDDADGARMRQQALDWLRADLGFYTKLTDDAPTELHAFVQKRLQHWLKETDFAGVRGQALAKLPETERPAWSKLWTDVEQTLHKAGKKSD
jgi:tetratricopeptide (TPR) repeat protein/serine/threonine protein kinase